jgi:hypothetical protein
MMEENEFYAIETFGSTGRGQVRTTDYPAKPYLKSYFGAKYFCQLGGMSRPEVGLLNVLSRT